MRFEDLSVAGSNGVRAYEDSELSGDQGYVLSLDLIYTLPNVDQISHSHNTSILCSRQISIFYFRNNQIIYKIFFDQ